jgi:2-methylcitrate dehydratase PrpD
MTLGMAEYYAPQSPMLRCTTYPSVVKDAAGPGAWAAGMALAMARENLPGLPSLLTVQAEGKRQIATVGDDWMIMRQYFKPYPVCRWAQPVVEGIRALRSEVEFGWQEIESIEVETFANASGLMHWPPKHSDAAQYSLPWAVAIFVVDGELGIEQVSPSRLDDPRVLDVGSRIRTRIADDIEARFPEEALARTVVKLRSGRVLESPTLSARGDYTDPLSDDEMNEKAMRLLTAGLGNQHSHAVYEILDTLHQRPASSLIEALRREAMTC